MEIEHLEGAVEALLFAMGESVEVSAIAKAIGHDTETTRKIIRNMMLKYNAGDRGIKIIELENAYQMCTKEEYYDYLVKLALQPKKAVLTDVMLETLSIIAYKQPVTKLEIEKIRGVKSDHAVNKLMEYNLVQVGGRLDAPGRPLLFYTGALVCSSSLTRKGLLGIMKLFGCRDTLGGHIIPAKPDRRCDMATDVLRHLYEEALDEAVEALTNLYGCMVREERLSQRFGRNFG